MQLNETFWFAAGLLCGVSLALLGARLWGKLCTGGNAVGRRRVLQYSGAGVALLVAATALYRHLGSPEALTTAPLASPLPHAAASAGAPAAAPSSMDAVTANLEARLRQNGGADADWQLLAQSYQFMGRDDAAALARKHQLPEPGAVVPAAAVSGAAAPVVAMPTARLTAEGEKLLTAAETARRKRDYPSALEQYRRLAALGQMTADSWADYADATASLNANSLVGEPEKYLAQALRLDPRHQKALWLQGSAEHETGRHAAAVQTWRKLLALMPTNSSDAKLIAANEREDALLAGGGARLAGMVTAAGPAAAAAVAATTAGGTVLRGEVTLDKALASRVRPGMTLYVVAKSVASPGPPVAVIRTTTGQWPVKFELTDALAMMPGRNLSSAGAVTVEARISQSGAANSAAGDLLGSVGPLQASGSKPLHIVIGKIVGQ